MRIVVTGGAGFIGANLVRTLAPVHEVVVLDDLSTGRRSNLEGTRSVRLIEGSILDDDALEEAFSGADAVAHLAARVSVPASVDDPVGTHEVNTMGTLRVMQAARRFGDLHVVWASSSAVYGAVDRLPVGEDTPPAPASPYAASKLAGEGIARSHAECYGLPVLTFRFFNVFGPLQPADHAYAAVVPAFVDAALAGRPLTVHGDGGQTRDFIPVSSVAATLARALTDRVVHPAPVNLAFGTRRSLLELVDALEAIVGPVTVDHRAPRPGDVRHSQADDRLLRRWFPDGAEGSFEDGLRDTVRWFQSQMATT